MSSFRARDATIYRPYPDEIPWDLLALADPDDARVASYADADFMRVAKHEGEVVGAYVVERRSATCFALRNLVVAPAYRRHRLGAWLLGHAIGLAESKGAREIVVPGAAPRGLFTRVGFVAEPGQLRLRLTPE